jgi:hypothetical protein
MPASVIGKSLNMGYPGNISRNDPRTFVRSRPVKTTVIPFGQPVILNTDNTFDPMVYNSAIGAVAGIALRNVKQQVTFGTNVAGQYAVGDACDVLEQGFVTVLANTSASLTAGGAVYANFDASTHAFKYFDISAGSDTAVALTNCKWATGIKDANGVAEIEITPAIMTAAGV